MDELSPDRRGEADRSGQEAEETVPASFTGFLELLPNPVVVVAEHTVVAGNDPAATLFDCTPETLQGLSLQTLFPGLDREAVEANCEAPAEEYLTCRAAGDGGPWVDLSFVRQRIAGRSYVVGAIHDVTERRERTRELEECEHIVEAMEDGVYVLDESFTIERVNGAVESMTGHDRDHLVGAPATLLADDEVVADAAAATADLLEGERDFATLTTELSTATGETLPIETRFTAHRHESGRYKHVGVVRDISNRRRFERTLRALHESTRELLQAETAEEVGEIVVESATTVLDAEDAAVYRFDAAANALHPRTLSSHLSAAEAGLSPVGPGESPVWESFVEGELVVGGAAPAGIAGGVCLPLGEYGVLVVALDDAEHDRDTVEVLELLAASGEAALARVDREQALRERDEELREQNHELRQLEEVNGIIRRIHQVLVDADTAPEIEQAVCDQLARSRWVSFAWLGRRDGRTVEPRAWAGDDPGYLDAVPLATDGGERPPAVRAVDTGSPTVVPAVADGLQSAPWRREALSRDYRSALSVPLGCDELRRGVLTVYGTERSVFDGMLESVFTELGETVAHAIREVKSRQRRSAATVTELEVTVTAPNTVLTHLADGLDTPVVCEGTVPQAGENTRLFVRPEGERDAGAVHDVGEALASVESLTAVADDASLFEAVAVGETVPQTLLDGGARIESVRAGPGGSLAATVRLPGGVDVRSFVELVADRYEDARLSARRERTVPLRTESGVHAAVEAALTDRQREVFETAYYSGFFDWPRETSGKEIADRLGVSQPTVSRHLRIAERKLLELVFGDRSPEV
jgi:PAS domain S-box-containing protein